VASTIERLGVPPANARALPVEAPYHTSLMAPVAAAVADAVADMVFRPPAVPVYSPTLGRVVDEASDVAGLLPAVLTTRLDWAGALHALVEAWPGCRFVDYSPSTALARFLRKNAVDVDWSSADQVSL
jgi:[acyl-carrier-protein] S-malonyltransferase